MMVLIIGLIYKVRKLSADNDKNNGEIKALHSTLESAMKRIEMLEKNNKINERAIRDFNNLRSEPNPTRGAPLGGPFCNCRGPPNDDENR